ncbi:bifunctional DNA-formamidopyrimidine glycosylase/DNA-(apurinic or apyrimidinic site) lyase [Anaplasma capra]|uniref:bifunctional DNA-formamidopyrimidine glycosylase/DNA-(apurinic or apyrimidinic site) lyase n=1 Tax=Anaplasma capra TaxID=1562740 RepID=UPI0021D58906|nr:bifunctional DNA-formamidopyrimidine glycosylase/DNA-(apurinic or apyrimidinic site) lyase [Anaplasma capra]MCU7611571.1 bifunctional DNA-formamidopyrimidine glycosylase/DNA-(apurinic or apyrimidinic site) lyase [Anaplasma capra]MCU7611990.1 bifunctional DNA-formamidopyrimidine glycosylase/DNA-(apurinic or apyrimidinic site) lyase [Anaplasma capra]
MPELPEVEVITSFFAEKAAGRFIKHVTINRRDLRIRIADGFEDAVVGERIKSVHRVSRHLVFLLSGSKRIMFHLGMSGKMTYAAPYVQSKHDHFVMLLDDEFHIVFNDPRRFGAVLLVNSRQYESIVKKIGPDPLSDTFNAEYLRQFRKSCVKSVLMNNAIVAGIGNIYASEILFRAGILPMRAMCDVSHVECERIVQEAKSTLRLAIDTGGSTIRDHKIPTGAKGGFQQYFMVYQRKGEPCRVCGACILSERHRGRSTFFCTSCQQ